MVRLETFSRGRSPICLLYWKSLLYVLEICYSAENMCTIERRLQQYPCRNDLIMNVSEFSSLESQIRFCRKWKLHLHPVLNLNGAILLVVDECHFLWLNFQSLISHLKTRCVSINLLNVLSNNDYQTKLSCSDYIGL